jgi:aminodeoxyfutalosine deaminase
VTITEFIAGLPKAELHVHQVGSASPRIVAELAARHPGVVPADPDQLREYFAFRDFDHFVEVYLSVVDLIRTAEDVRILTYEVAREMAGQQLRYAELTCTPYTSVIRGIPIEAYTEAIEDARVAAERDFGLVLRWIYDIPGESGLPAADATLEYALQHPPDALVGFGLGGPEIGVPRPQFQPHFDAARAAGLRSVPHAGETTGPQTVWDAIRLLGAERIGHGTSAASDPELLAHLARHGIPLEVCPTSNLATRAVESLDDHPLRTFVEAGVPVTINSDDPPMFGTDLNTEYAVAAQLLDLDETGVAGLAQAAILTEIEAYVAA